MEKKKNLISVCKNGVIVRTNNRRTEVIETSPEEKYQPENLIRLTSLTAETGPLPGMLCEITSNDKLKVTSLGLSDQGLVDLYIALKTYLNK